MNKKFLDFSNFKGDLFGGITAGIVALPLALAFGVSSGLGPTAGLYGAIFLGFFASFLGGTPSQISGPTAPVTAVSMAVIAGLLASFDGNLSLALPIILSVFLMAGLIQILMGMTGVGAYIRYIPYPVISGFMSAIGFIIIITQLLPLLGYYPKEDVAYVEQFKPHAKEMILKSMLENNAPGNTYTIEAFNKTIEEGNTISEDQIQAEAGSLAASEAAGVMGAIKSLPRAIQNINWIEFALAIATILIIYGFKRITTKVPSTLVALMVVSLSAYFFNLNYRAIDQIPGGFPVPFFELFTNFNIGQIAPYIFTAFTIALLGSIDSLLTSVVADNMTKTRHNSNRELIGQGVGNSMAALFGGIPGAGATIRTVVNINAGGKTKLSGMVAAILLLVIMLAVAPVASKIPAAVLAGILITVGIGVMDYKGLRAIPSMPKDIKLGPVKLSSEVLILVTVLLLSTFWNLVYAVGIGMVFAALMFMKKMGDLTARKSNIYTLGAVPVDQLRAEARLIPEEVRQDVYVKKLEGPVFFGVTDEVKALSSQIPQAARFMVMRMENVPYMDQSGVYTLEDIFLDLEGKGVEMLLVGVQPQPAYMLQRIKIIPDLVQPKHVFKTYEDCLRWIEKQQKSNAG